MAERKDFTEDLFQAIQTITDKTLEGLKYDKTILCSVIDDTNREEGQYTVSDGAVEFTAYSDNTKYREGNNVYVTIPEGSYDNRRIIIGKYQKDEESPYIYISPMENYVNITHNLINNEIIDPKAEGLIANGNIKLQLIQSLTGLSYSGYDRLGIRANFMSLLNEFNTTHGNYGLALKINCYEKRTTEYERALQDDLGNDLWADDNLNNEKDANETLVTLESGAKTQTYWLYFDSDDMFGNPYNFVTYISQEKVFDISSFAQIDSIELYFYQGDNFLDNTDTPIPSFGKSIIDGIEIIDDFASNLFVNDIEITLGYDLAQFENNTILLYTLDSKTYSAIADQNNGNLKTIEMRWIRDVANNMIAFDENNDLLPDENIEIHWYRWHLANNIFDDLAGAFWEEDIDLLEQSNKFKKVFHPAVNLQQERLKVIIVHHIQGITEEDSYDEIFESNILELENEDQVPNPATIDLIRGLQLTTDDDYNGIYCLYGQNMELMNDKEAKIERHLIASYESLVTGIKGLDGTETVTWKVPATNTMIGDIKAPGENAQWNIGWVIENDYRVLANQPIPTVESFKNTVGETENRKAYISYKIENVYSQVATNNTVICIIHKNNLDYQAELPMSFATAGTNGTDYTLVLEVSDGDKHSLGVGANSKLTVRAQLRNYDNTPVSNAKINFHWWGFSGNANGISLSTVTKKNDFSYCTITNTAGWSGITKALILEAQTNTPDTNIELRAQLPISLSTAAYTSYILEGPTKIIFDNIGTNCIYIRKPYKLFNKEKTANVVWTTSMYSPNETSSVPNANYNGYPTIETNNNSYYLVPPQMYLNNLKNIVCVMGRVDNNLVFIQPILMIQNHFGSPMLNRWDGSLQIDTEGNSILTSVIGAGKKESDNSFSGVLMGEVGKNDSNSAATNEHGLLGYNTGKRTFLLSSKTGKLVLGASGQGQITMDGASGVIQSGNYKSNTSGMKINLPTGAIDAYNFKLTSKNVIIDSTGSDNNPNLLIRDNSNPQKILMKVGSSKSNFFLQSADQNIKFDLGLSQFIAKNNFRFQALKENTGIDFGIGTTSAGAVDYPFFYIKKNGTNLFALDNSNYYLQSVNYSVLNHTGVQFNLNTGKITGYDTILKFDQSALKSFINGAQKINSRITESDLKSFYNDTLTADQLKSNYNLTDANIKRLNDLKSEAPNTHTLFLDSTASNTPFKVGSKFKVNWDGSIESSGGIIGGWTIDANRLSSNSGSVGMAKYINANYPIFWSGYAAYGTDNWKTKVGFGVSGDGKLYANAGTIGSWNINPGYLQGSGSGSTIKLEPTQITLGNYDALSMDQSTGQLSPTGTSVTAKIEAAGGKFTGAFVGNLTGNADTAGWAWSATRATGDKNGNDITTTYAAKSHTHSYAASGHTHSVSITPNGHTHSFPTYHTHTITVTVTGSSLLGFKASATCSGPTTFTSASSGTTGSTSLSASANAPSGGGQCFVGDTQILMADNTLKSIKDVQVGDYIIAYNEITKSFVTKKVIKTTKYCNVKKLIKIQYNNSYIIMTPGHPVYTIEGWKSRDLGDSFKTHIVETKYLTKKDKLIGYRHKIFPIQSILTIQEKDIPIDLFVYNITVDGVHTYIANNIIVHNAAQVPK